MTGDDTASLIYGLLVALLVASSLFARRLPRGQTMKMLLTWVAIFGTIFVLFSFRHEGKAIWNRITAELSPGGIEERNGELRVRTGEDGHFWLDTVVNGKSVRMMVDSGATTTAMSEASARDAGVEIDADGFPVAIDTANGTVQAQRGRIAKFRVGPIERKDFAVIVSDRFGDTNVVGMNFLSTLSSWRVEKNELILNPGGSPSK